MSVSFRELDKVCEKLGLTMKKTKKGYIWTGLANGRVVRISVHKHAGGRDIPVGTLSKYLNQLGFRYENELKEFLKK